MPLSTTKPPIPTIATKTPTVGYLRVPALLDESCPHCHEANPDTRNVRVWRVSDERGLHHECDWCATIWFPDGRVVKPR